MAVLCVRGCFSRTRNSQREIPFKWDQAVNLISQKWGSSAVVSLHNLHVEYLVEIMIKKRSRIRNPVPPMADLDRFITNIVGWAIELDNIFGNASFSY